MGAIGSMRRSAGVAAGLAAAALLVPSATGAARTTETTAGPPKGGSRTGVSRRVITIGMHAPLSGAVPFPSESMEQAKDIYFRWLRLKDRDINGRRVRVILKNDNYNPSDAVAACKELVEEEKVFALVGFSGVDQMQACARYAASVDVPYLSPGSTEYRLDLSQTFATTMTWPDQGKLMADFMVTKLKARRRNNAMVWYDSPNHRSAHDRFVASMERRKADVYSRSVPTQANTADAVAVVQDLEAREVRNVYVHVTPIFFLQILRSAGQQNYHPRWTGIDLAITSSPSVANVGCGDAGATLEGARFLAPYPAFVDRFKFDKKYAWAMRSFYDEDEGDGTVWANWAQQKVIAKLLRRPGRNLTRKRFVWFAEHGARIKTGIGSRLRYRPKNHFGADQVHLVKATCSDRDWHTVKSFVSDF